MVSDMSDVEQRSWERLAEWMKQRYHAECSAVSAVHKLASQAAFAGQPLPFQLDLQVRPCHELPVPVGCSPCILLSNTKDMSEHICIKLASSATSARHTAAQPISHEDLDVIWDGAQGEQLVIDEDAAAIKAEPPRQLAPLPQPPAAPGLLPSHLFAQRLCGHAVL